MNVAKNLAGNTGHVLQREDYKKVKKMDRTQFEGFCNRCTWKGIRMAETLYMELISPR